MGPRFPGGRSTRILLVHQPFTPPHMRLLSSFLPTLFTVAVLACSCDSTSPGVPNNGGNDDDDDDPPPSSASVTASGTSFSPSSVTIATNGTVTWTFNDEHNVTFGDEGPDEGNVPNQSSGTATRTFS